MSQELFFSVVIPTYNRADFIVETISHILKQDFKSYEIIIVDDGSTDNTSEVISKSFIGNPSIKYIRQENSERGAARNHGFRLSRGKYVVFFDSDDIMHSNHLNVLHKLIVEQNNPDYIATRYDFQNDDGERYPSTMEKISPGYYDYQLFLNGNPLACNFCIRKDNPRLLLFPEDRKYAIMEDWLFLIQNLKHSKIYISGECTLTIRDHENRSMRSGNSILIQKVFVAFQWITKNIQLTGDEQCRLAAHVNYFSAIHSYLDRKRADGFKYIYTAIRKGGLRFRYIILFGKLLLGRKISGIFR